MTDTDLGRAGFAGTATSSTSPTSPTEQAVNTRSALAHNTRRLLDAVEALDERAMRAPSKLPGWTRGHLITHLARNADAMLNLLIWARTGVEHPAYSSRADRNADIEAGAVRPRQILAEDLLAASERFAYAARELPDSAWETVLDDGRTDPLPAFRIPWWRRREVLVHTDDLDAGVGFEYFAPAELAELVDDVAAHYTGHAGVPPTTVTVTFPGGAQGTWGIGRPGTPATVCGPAAAVVAWLTGRGDTDRLSGTVPRLPTWL